MKGTFTIITLAAPIVCPNSTFTWKARKLRTMCFRSCISHCTFACIVLSVFGCNHCILCYKYKILARSVLLQLFRELLIAVLLPDCVHVLHNSYLHVKNNHGFGNNKTDTHSTCLRINCSINYRNFSGVWIQRIIRQ